MGLDLLNAFCGIARIRWHIPHDGDFGSGGGRNQPVLISGQNRLVWLIAGLVVTISLVSLALWAAVWLTMRSL